MTLDGLLVALRDEVTVSGVDPKNVDVVVTGRWEDQDWDWEDPGGCTGIANVTHVDLTGLTLTIEVGQ